MNPQVSVETIDKAAENLKKVAKKTPLEYNERLSKQYSAKVYIKREDLQEIRSYKIRGAYNLMSSLGGEETKRGVVCASAGNHAQGVASSAAILKMKATIFMPNTTSLQKIQRVKYFGGKWIRIQFVGENFDECYKAALMFAQKAGTTFVPTFDDERIITGQGTIGKEIYDELGSTIDYILCPIGGGGLIAGTGTYLSTKIPTIKVIGVEPKGCASMYVSLLAKKVTPLKDVDSFVDGAAIGTVGEKTFAIASKLIDKILVIPEGKVCVTMIELYQNEGIIAEPAGALSLSALDEVAGQIKGKTVVCILSGGNNDIYKYPQIIQKSQEYLQSKK